MGKKSRDLTQEELAAQRGEELPPREVMSTVSIDPVVYDDPTGPYSPDGDSTQPMPASTDNATADGGGGWTKDIGPPQPVPPGEGDPQPVPPGPGPGGPDPYEQSVEPDGGPEPTA